MSEQAPLSYHLREQYEDIRELYEAAKLNENAPQMEKLSKAMAGLVKQIKDQELHERETLKRDEVRRLGRTLGISVAKNVRRFAEDQDVAVLIIESIVSDIATIIEDKSHE